MISLLLVVTMINSGHWYSGETVWVDLHWNIQPPPVEARAVWHLSVGRAILANGVLLSDDEELTKDKSETQLYERNQFGRLALALPEVRISTRAELKVYLEEEATGEWLETQVFPVWLYPSPAWVGENDERLPSAPSVTVFYWGQDSENFTRLADAHGFKVRSITGLDPIADYALGSIVVHAHELSNKALREKLRESAKLGARVIELQDVGHMAQGAWVTVPLEQGSWTQLQVVTDWANDPRAATWLVPVMEDVFCQNESNNSGS